MFVAAIAVCVCVCVCGGDAMYLGCVLGTKFEALALACGWPFVGAVLAFFGFAWQVKLADF